MPIQSSRKSGYDGPAHSVAMRLGSVPCMSHRPGANSRLLLAVYERWQTALYKRCMWGWTSFTLWSSLGLHASSRLWWHALCGYTLTFRIQCLVFGLQGLRCWLFCSWSSTFEMDASPFDSPVRTYVDDYYCMGISNDADRSDPVGFSSLGVVDLDTTIVPDVFGWPFNEPLAPTGSRSVRLPPSGRAVVAPLSPNH